jgi:HTH-type transcriptional regulator / antitoxin MqsA
LAHCRTGGEINKSFEYEQLGAWCRQCSEGVLTGDETTATEPLLDAFVTQVHEEETKELARIRKKLKLTQQQAANLTGGGHNAFSRYERGDARPLPAVMNLFRLLDHHPELLKEL